MKKESIKLSMNMCETNRKHYDPNTSHYHDHLQSNAPASSSGSQIPFYTQHLELSGLNVSQIISQPLSPMASYCTQNKLQKPLHAASGLILNHTLSPLAAATPILLWSFKYPKLMHSYFWQLLHCLLGMLVQQVFTGLAVRAEMSISWQRLSPDHLISITPPPASATIPTTPCFDFFLLLTSA